MKWPHIDTHLLWEIKSFFVSHNASRWEGKGVFRDVSTPVNKKEAMNKFNKAYSDIHAIEMCMGILPIQSKGHPMARVHTSASHVNAPGPILRNPLFRTGKYWPVEVERKIHIFALCRLPFRMFSSRLYSIYFSAESESFVYFSVNNKNVSTPYGTSNIKFRSRRKSNDNNEVMINARFCDCSLARKK